MGGGANDSLCSPILGEECPNSPQCWGEVPDGRTFPDRGAPRFWGTLFPEPCHQHGHHFLSFTRRSLSSLHHHPCHWHSLLHHVAGPLFYPPSRISSPTAQSLLPALSFEGFCLGGYVVSSRRCPCSATIEPV